MFCLCLSVEQGLDSTQEILRSLNRPLRLGLRHMCCAPIIPNIAYFKKPVQILALVLAQFPRLDKSLMNRSNDPAMLAEIQTLVQQNRCGSVKGCIIRTRRCKIVVAFDGQVFSRFDRLLCSYSGVIPLSLPVWRFDRVEYFRAQIHPEERVWQK